MSGFVFSERVKILIILFSCCHLSANTNDILMRTAANKDSIHFHEITEIHLNEILEQLETLDLYLSTVKQAINNHFIEYLLKQNICPLRIFVANTAITGLTVQNYQRNRAVAVHSLSLNSPFALNKLATRNGFLFCILLDQPDRSALRQTAIRLWQSKGIYKIYYLTIKSIFYFNPFARNTASNEFGDFIDVRTQRMNEIFKNLNGFPLRIYVFDSVYSTMYGDAETKVVTKITGADSEAAILLGRKLNFMLDLQWPDDEFFGARLDNGSYNGAIGRLIRDETDIVMTGFFVKDYLTRDVDFSVAVYMDDLCCIVAKAKQIPQSILPVLAVRVNIWISFFTVGALGPFMWMALRYLNLNCKTAFIKETKIRKCAFDKRFQYIRIFIDFWVVWVRVNIIHFPPFYSERIFVISLCLVSVIYGALIESSLATVYIRPLHYRDINTLKELDNLGFNVYIKHAAMKDDLFYGHTSEVYQNLDKKMILVGETEDRLINIISKRSGFAAVTRSSSLILNDLRYVITKKIHKILECPKSYNIAFVYQKDSPFENVVNVQLLHFVEGGLFEHWISIMKHKWETTIHHYPEYLTNIGYEFKSLTLNNLQLSFFALLLGCSLASLSFLFEILCKRKLALFK